MELVANFTLNNEALDAQFDVSEVTNLDALFQIDTDFQVAGEGVIDVTLIDGVSVITSKTYTHEQGIASDSWVIEHNLNKYPSVTLVDSAGTQFQGRVEYINENKCIVYMNGETTGKAYLN